MERVVILNRKATEMMSELELRERRGESTQHQGSMFQAD